MFGLQHQQGKPWQRTTRGGKWVCFRQTQLTWFRAGTARAAKTSHVCVQTTQVTKRAGQVPVVCQSNNAAMSSRKEKLSEHRYLLAQGGELDAESDPLGRGTRNSYQAIDDFNPNAQGRRNLYLWRTP